MSWLDEFRSKDRRILSRLISHVEDRRSNFRHSLAQIYAFTGHAYKIGITGPPGAGKSTLVDHLAQLFVADGRTVGVIAVDPTSPFTGGALLGDRIRMQDLVNNEAVFIRSMATRGSSGGLAQATRDVSVVYDAFGFDYILIETVGVGQVELDIVDAADTIVVVLVPESGDTIQAMKAGLMEIADVFCLNKSDREGADRAVAELNQLLQIKRAKSEWTLPVVATSAANNKNIDLLAKTIFQHRAYLDKSARLAARRKSQIRKEVLDQIRWMLAERIEEQLLPGGTFEALLEEVGAGRLDPATAAQRIFQEHYNTPGNSSR